MTAETFVTPEEKARSEIMNLVREYGRERYRHGKADVRGKSGQTKPQRRQRAKAKEHARIAVEIRDRIEKALSEGPYL